MQGQKIAGKEYAWIRYVQFSPLLSWIEVTQTKVRGGRHVCPIQLRA